LPIIFSIMTIARRETTKMKKILLGFFVLTIATLISTSAYSAWGCGYGPGMMGWGFGGFMGPVIMLLILIAAIIGITYAVRAVSGHPRGTGTVGESPLDIAKRRYAKGEIGRDEFEKIKEDLRSA
jgi:putative membrane protein